MVEDVFATRNCSAGLGFQALRFFDIISRMGLTTANVGPGLAPASGRPKGRPYIFTVGGDHRSDKLVSLTELSDDGLGQLLVYLIVP